MQPRRKATPTVVSSASCVPTLNRSAFLEMLLSPASFTFTMDVTGAIVPQHEHDLLSCG